MAQHIGQRIKEAREAAGFTQGELGKAAGVSASAVSQWENGDVKGLKPENLLAVAKKLSLALDYLVHGKGPKKAARNNTESAPDFRYEVPLISWVKAGKAAGIHDPYSVGEGEKPVYTSKKLGPNAFALRVKGDSMEDPRGRRHYPEGSIILVDPDRPVTSGKPVVARFNDVEEATFKMYVEDNGKRWLKPLNDSYESVEIDKNVTICGVVVQTVIDED